MDLLPVPLVDPSWPTPAAPYVCGDKDRNDNIQSSKPIPWDGSTFLSFPLRSGRIGWVAFYIRDLFAELHSDELWTEQGYRTPRDLKEPWFQQWLFFGLIAEFLGLNAREDGVAPAQHEAEEQNRIQEELANLYNTFTRSDDDGRIVLTGLPIIDLVPMAFERARKASPDGSLDAYFLPQMSRCLKLTYFMIALYDENKIDTSVKYSICALGEFLSGVFSNNITKLDATGHLPYHFTTPWQDSYLLNCPGVKERMLSAGWCISDISRAQFMYNRLSPLHFLSRLKLPNARGNHSLCTENLCLAGQIDATTYRPMHISDSCSCPDLDFDGSDVLPMLELGMTYPVLRFSKTDDSRMKLEVEAYSPEVPYIALSHVWADGLGNPKANTLPECQIIRLAQLVVDLEKRIELREEQKPCYEHTFEELLQHDTSLDDMSVPSYRLWLDTICCPVETTGKHHTLNRMPDIYRNAKHVLVLDSSVASYTFKSREFAERNMLIWAASAWMRRLWTLQEGALSKNLWICFKDMNVDFQDALAHLWALKNKYPQYITMFTTIFQEHVEMAGFFPENRYRDTPGVVMPTVHLYNLQRCLFHRSVSVAVDEPVCLSTLLRLDLSQIVSIQDKEDRMIRFWQLVSDKYNGIPVTIVFSLDDTCTRLGWRWAPLSLVNPRMNGYDTLQNKCLRFGSPSDKPPMPHGLPTALGLCTNLPGYLASIAPVSSKSAVARLFESLLLPGEPYIVFNHGSNGDFWRFSDAYFTLAISGVLSEAEVDQYDEVTGRPMQTELSTRRCVIISSPAEKDLHTKRCIIAEIIDEVEGNQDEEMVKSGLRVHPIREIIMSRFDTKHSMCCKKADAMAIEAARGIEDRWLTGNETIAEDDWADAREDLKQRLVVAMAKELDSDAEFSNALTNMWSRGMEHAWRLALRVAWARAVLKPLPDDQTWYFD